MEHIKQRNSLQLDAALYGELFKNVAPKIVRKNTKMRELVSASQCSSVTLRSLDTGNTF
jgi:hypothetical protein